jgi:AbrB family looped-hinge helix DNA binding protein
MEEEMPIAVLTSKGQMTIPKGVRKALDLKPSGKVIIVVDGDRAILKPPKGVIFWTSEDRSRYRVRECPPISAKSGRKSEKGLPGKWRRGDESWKRLEGLS